MALLELSSFSDEETACDRVFPPALPHPLPSSVWLVLDPTLPREGPVAAERCSGSGGGGRGERRVHVSSEPQVGHVAALLLLQCGAHVDLFRKVLFCRARPGAAPERKPAGAADHLATRLLKRAASPTCSTPCLPLPL